MVNKEQTDAFAKAIDTHTAAVLETGDPALRATWAGVLEQLKTFLTLLQNSRIVGEQPVSADKVH